MKITISDTGITYSELFKTKTVEFKDVKNAYLRIEEVKSRSFDR